MSRIGKKPIKIKERVEAELEQDQIKIKGPKGELSQKIPSEIKIELRKGKIFVRPAVETKRTSSLWGLTRTLIANMVKGVTDGFEKKLQIEGVGFKADMEGDNLVLKVGFTHPVKIAPGENIKFSVEKNIITVSGINKESVGQVAAKIRRVRPPDVYKGKGIRYVGEVVKKKVGKRAASI